MLKFGHFWGPERQVLQGDFFADLMDLKQEGTKRASSIISEPSIRHISNALCQKPVIPLIIARHWPNHASDLRPHRWKLADVSPELAKIARR